VLFRTWEAAPPEQAVTEVTDHVGVTHTVVTSPSLIKQILADPGTFRADNALDAMTPLPVSVMRVLAGHRFKLPPTLANNSSLSHPGIRDITMRALSQERVSALRPWLTDLVRDKVAVLEKRLDAGETVDIYADLTAEIPLTVLAKLVELPDAGASTVKEFSRAALELFWAPVDEPRQLHLARIVGQFHEVLRAHSETAGGMVGELREHTLREGLPRDTPIGALFFLLVAGQETTSQFLTLLLHRLTSEPDVVHLLTSGAIDSADVVEEGLRLVPPIPTWRRVTSSEVELDGVTVPSGRSVVLWLAQAGLSAKGPEFTPGRGSRRHLAFGAGAHRCAGAQLSRMEAAVIVEQTAPLLLNATVIKAPWCPDNLSFRMPDAFMIARPHTSS
jgi:cytochrome P450